MKKTERVTTERLIFNGVSQCLKGSTGSSSACKRCFKKCASKNGSRINVGIRFTYRKLPSVHFESVPRGESKSLRNHLRQKSQSVENAGVIFVKGANERN